MTFSPTLAVAAVAGVFMLGFAVQTARLDQEQTAHTEFVTEQRVMGEVQTRLAKAADARNKANKEKTDAKTQADLGRLAADNQRLRDERARSSLVPSPDPASKSPEIACFGRAELQRALQRFEDAVATGFESCDQTQVMFNNALEWASQYERDHHAP